MLNLYGGQGMGSAGMGVGAGGALSLPQLLAMMGQGQQAAQPPSNPFSQAGAPTPMSAFLGQMGPKMGAMASGAPTAPVAAPVNPDAGAQQGGGMGGNTDLLKMLMAMKGGQTGVAPTGGVPTQMAPGVNNPGLDALLRSLGMFGGITGGAPT